MTQKILIINTGSTSVKFDLFVDNESRAAHTVTFSDTDRQALESTLAARVSDFLKANNTQLSDLSAIAARGGLLKPLEAGTYLITEEMVADLSEARYGRHPSNYAAPLAVRLARQAGIPAYTVNPVTVDEMDEIAHMTGILGIRRRSIFHVLSHKACARRAADELGKPYEKCNFIIVHMGGGISIGAHCNGRVVDVNNALDGDGPIAPERAGSIPAGQLASLCFSGAVSREDMAKILTGYGGVFALLGTRNMQTVEEMIRNGDTKALRAVEAMAYSICKEIGAMAAVLNGKVDAVVLTGGLASWQRLVDLIRERIQFIGPILVYTENMEMQELAQSVLNVLDGVEQCKAY